MSKKFNSLCKKQLCINKEIYGIKHVLNNEDIHFLISTKVPSSLSSTRVIGLYA